METKKQMEVLMDCRKNNVGRFLSMHKRAFDEWALHILKQKGYPDFKMSYFPIIMNIGTEGSTNKEIAAQGKVSKQAMSKVIKELEAMKLIRSDIHPEDKRSSIIYLTKKGMKMVVESRAMVMELEAKYENVVGKNNYAVYKRVMKQLINFHWEDF